jgi:hypothetical protein
LADATLPPEASTNPVTAKFMGEAGSWQLAVGSWQLVED